jgi:uncharacterized protein YbbC (DUF1343 family)
MVRTGLQVLLGKFPEKLKNKRVGILCHAPSITPDFRHITEIIHTRDDCRLGALFGPQHGLFGETQDNMIEWTGELHPHFNIPVFSLYGEHRKPTSAMLQKIDTLIVDLQDVGARLYTYAWTMKLCMEACSEAGIPIWVLDRPNPVAGLALDGPVLKEQFFTFVGGATIPMCHRMTIGEIALWIREKYFAKCDLNVIRMENWERLMMWDQTGLPWVIPSPNMPTLSTAVVYPGMVLFEALNVSEGRGTTIPFELFGAPFINAELLINNLRSKDLPGCRFRIHNFIPTFNKYEGKLCSGLQVHVTDLRTFRPVAVAAEIIRAIMETTQKDSLIFNDPPYEYEYEMVPFDILAGDSLTRNVLVNGGSLKNEFQRWEEEIELFRREFSEISLYGK